MKVLFLRFLDRVLNMVDEPVVLFDKELNPIRANMAGWRFFDSCRKEGSLVCEGCPAKLAKESGLPCVKSCRLGLVRSEPLLNSDGVLEGVTVILLGPERPQREYGPVEIEQDLREV
jgi:hypothetical protein